MTGVQTCALPISIGRRTAQKLAFYVLKMPDSEAVNLAEAIRAVKEDRKSVV